MILKKIMSYTFLEILMVLSGIYQLLLNNNLVQKLLKYGLDNVYIIIKDHIKENLLIYEVAV